MDRMIQVLLVDDNAVQALVRKAILGRSVGEVAIAPSAKAALEMIWHEQVAAKLELVITDHWMPGMNGPEFVRRLRQQLPEIPVVVLSGQPDAEPEYQGLDVHFRTKPVDPQELIGLARELMQTTRENSAWSACRSA